MDLTWIFVTMLVMAAACIPLALIAGASKRAWVRWAAVVIAGVMLVVQLGLSLYFVWSIGQALKAAGGV